VSFSGFVSQNCCVALDLETGIYNGTRGEL
jgi:hypothetical protein